MLELTAMAAVAVATMAKRQELYSVQALEVTWVGDPEDPDNVWLLDLQVLAA